MEYRKLPKGNEQISIIGMGTSSVCQGSAAEIEATVREAVESGVNYFDLATAHGKTFAPFGNAITDTRKNIYLQVHFGAEYTKGEYGWTLDTEKIKRSVDWQLNALKTDYIDFGFLHCLDEMGDLEQVLNGRTLEYVLELKKAGVVKHIALSTHTPEIGMEILKHDIIDMLMFSINPGYDYSQGEFAIGGAQERMELYRACEAKGVGISVMKPFSGGQLLDEKLSPFSKALTRYQCIQYALDKPGVLTVLPGVRDRKELRDILGFLDAGEEERDYSVLGTFAPSDAVGKCVYCGHCKPCPEGLDVGLINKYYDLAQAGDVLAKDHYLHLEKKASDCIACGHCDKRCPFKVAQSERMQEIAEYFGK